jgi:zinc transport system ATP-binding protein
VPLTPPIFWLRSATAGYDGSPVLHAVNFSLEAGEVVAVLGANGSGKSTLVRTLLQLTPMTSGALDLFGVPAGEFGDWARIGYVPQRQSVAGTVPATVREVVASGRLSRMRRFRPMTAADRAAINDAIAVVDLTAKARKPIAELSGGQQRRVLIARALAGAPDVLVMDEPMAGVDLASQTVLSETFAGLVRRGVTILLVAHELGPVAPLVTRVVTMRDGAVVYDGPIGAHDDDGDHRDHDPHPHGEHTPPSGIGLTGSR